MSFLTRLPLSVKRSYRFPKVYNRFSPARWFTSISSQGPPPDSGNDNDTDFGSQYSFKESEIGGNRTGQDGLLLMAYTCAKCDTKQARTFSRHSYEHGVVLIRCQSCDSLHLIADNLGWFEDEKVNIEEIMRRKEGSQEVVRTNITDQAVEIVEEREIVEEE